MRTRDILAGAVQTRLHEWGPVDAPPALLLHDAAFGADGPTAWGHVAERLADDFRLVAPDLLGYGGSDKVIRFDRSHYDPRIDQLAAVCDTLGIQHPHIVGTSFGGSVALRLLLRADIGLIPRSVATISGTGGPWRAPGSLQVLTDYDEPDLASMRRIVVHFVDDDFPGLVQLVDARHRNTLVPGHLESVKALALRNPAVPPPEDTYPDTLAGVDTPVLLIRCGRDELVQPEWADELADRLGAAQVLDLDTRHSPNIDHPDLVADALRQFWEGVEAAGTGG